MAIIRIGNVIVSSRASRSLLPPDEQSNTICPKIEISFFLVSKWKKKQVKWRKNLLCQSDQFSNREQFFYNTYSEQKLIFLHSDQSGLQWILLVMLPTQIIDKIQLQANKNYKTYSTVKFLS